MRRENKFDRDTLRISRFAHVYFLVGFFLLTSIAIGQIRIDGTVRNSGSRLDFVTIKVYRDGKLERSVRASDRSRRKGNFSLQLDVGKDYLLVFTRPYMIARKVSIATHVPEEVLEQNEKGLFLDYGDFTLYDNFKELDAALFDTPTHHMFFDLQASQFVQKEREDYGKQLAAFSKANKSLKANGAKAVKQPRISDPYAIQSAEHQQKEQESDGIEGPTGEQPGTEVVQPVLAEVVEAEQESPLPKQLTNIQRHVEKPSTKIDSGTAVRSTYEGELLRMSAEERRKEQNKHLPKRDAAQEQMTVALLDSDLQRKVARESWKQEQEKERLALQEARSIKSESMEDLLRIAAEEERKQKRLKYQQSSGTLTRSKKNTIKPIVKRDTIEGTFQTDYITAFCFPGKRTVYKKVMYVYGRTAYFRNGQEINADVYENSIITYSYP